MLLPNGRSPNCQSMVREESRVNRQLNSEWGSLSVFRDKLVVIAVCMHLAGCGGATLDEEITGKVTFQNKPVTEGTVTFFRSSTGSVAQGALGAGGVYTLVQVGSSLLPGEYHVTIAPLSDRKSVV